MLALVAAFSASLLLTLILVRAARGVGHASMDIDTDGPQKFHTVPVPRSQKRICARSRSRRYVWGNQM